MKKLETGLYEELISKELDERLNSIDEPCKFTEQFDATEAPAILADYAESVIKSGLKSIQESSEGVTKQVELVNKIISLVNEYSENSDDNLLSQRSEQLKALLLDKSLVSLTDTKAKDMIRPVTSISESSLFTGANREPGLYTEINKEIASCDRIDMMVSFIRWSGLRLILKELTKFTEEGHSLRIITTTYMGATEFKAIEELSKLKNTEIKISYDVARTRLHAKVYVFHRNTGYSTAYVGSSNLTAPAMKSGCEWNVKFTKHDSKDMFEKVEASYNGYWNSNDFEEYDESKAEMLKEALLYQRNKKAGVATQKRTYFMEAHPYPYQEAILDRLRAERQIRNSWKNLVSAATGTGKTIIAAFDYKSQVDALGYKPNLLFIAHRKEILEQSIECFREVLQDSDFADLYVGSYMPRQTKHLFISNDMINSKDFMGSLSRDYYEYIVFDECHHIAAKTYQNVLNYFEPKILLGLTATPYRMDGVDILQYFNNRVAAEVSLADAIDRKLLCPFQYFGIADDVDLSELKWSRGGYDKNELENVYVFSREIAEKRAKLIIRSLDKYIADLDQLKALVFCVSVEHAKFMAEKFNEAGFAAEALSGQSSEGERAKTRQGLENGTIKLVCVVDLYNEGIDIKQINTVLFLRPTESLTIFLQQLGRGLRLADGKDCLTVLDYVGQANKKYNFEMKFKALLPGSNLGVKREIEADFPHLPRGCFVSLERKAKEIVLSNIRNAVTERMGILDRLRTFEEDTGKPLTFANFAKHYAMTAQAFYAQRFKWTFYDAVERAGIHVDMAPNSDEDAWKKIYRFTTIDDLNFIDYLINALEKNTFSDYGNRVNDGYCRAVYVSLFEDKQKPNPEELIPQRLRRYFIENPRMKRELIDLLYYMRDEIDFSAKQLRLPYANVLKVHCAYTRRQALATLDSWAISSEGVSWVPDKRTMLLFVTLNKSNNYYSPSTSYHDYSINSKMFHWQSQNAHSETTTVGQRYINHIAQGVSILLFVREQKEGLNGSTPFTLLGKVKYVSHTGSKPMSIIWELEDPIPAKFLHVTDQLGIG